MPPLSRSESDLRWESGRPSGRVFSARPNQYFCRDTEALVQTSDHSYRESSLSVQDLGDAGAGADDLLQVAPGEALLIHTEFDRLDGIRRVHRIVLSLIGVDKRCEHIQSVAVARSRFCAPEALNLLERGFMIPLCPDRLYLSRHAAPLSHRSCRSSC